MLSERHSGPASIPNVAFSRAGSQRGGCHPLRRPRTALRYRTQMSTGQNQINVKHVSTGSPSSSLHPACLCVCVSLSPSAVMLARPLHRSIHLSVSAGAQQMWVCRSPPQSSSSSGAVPVLEAWFKKSPLWSSCQRRRHGPDGYLSRGEADTKTPTSANRAHSGSLLLCFWSTCCADSATVYRQLHQPTYCLRFLQSFSAP